ncbi:OmpA family protein [Parvicella tangerina]|uniref:Peptidoglycan-associated lipoprotein n=1 Tax=Parvicella tangerina TaxID=2829795 RepID=A0A916JK54_9FLAO|nr:OmpA family protein [Parvicella tangerina]CAG5077913.1 Peptidoglycan-associated lipoprotein [Parvicella tangerina]
MARVFFSIIFALAVLLGFAQNNDSQVIDDLHFADAIRKYEKTLKKNPEDTDAHYNLAIAYSKVGDMDHSFEHYFHLITTGYDNFDPNDWNNIGQYALSQGITDLAERAFNELEEIAPSMKLQMQPRKGDYFKPFTVEGINTEFNDFSPVIFRDQVVFTSDRPASVYDLSRNKWSDAPYLSIFKFDTTSNEVKLFGDHINDVGHNGPISFTKEEHVAFITRASIENRNSVNHSKIIIASSDKKDWDNQHTFNINLDSNFSCAHPILLEELNMLIFSSNKPGGKGGMDLYYSSYGEDSEYSAPQPIATINTPFNEVFPCRDANDPNSIYFSSNGYRGFGGLDIYKTTYKNGKWSKPELMPKAINSSYDDFGLVFLDENSGYVSSNRIGGKGGDDIYYFLRSSKFTLEGYLVDDDQNLPLPLQKIYIVDENNQIIDSVFSNEEGYFEYEELPYQSIGLMPPDEEGNEMIVRPKSSDLSKDPATSLYLMTSKGFVDDSIALDQPAPVTFVISSYKGKKSRCVVYENGDKAVSIIFNVKNKNGKIIDELKTGKNGCFKLEKLYPEDSYLELSEEFLEMDMRMADDSAEENWQDKTKSIRIITNQKCVEYEDGSPAINVTFAVKDSLGNIIDEVVTNQNGCFNIRKLYDDDTYLELLEEELLELGMKLMPPYDQEEFMWLKSDEKIILKYGRKCMVYKNGGYPANAKYIIKDKEGEVIEGGLTDENGCLKIRKLNSDDAYNVYVLDEEGLTYQAKMDTNKLSYLILERTEMDTEDFEFVTITVKRCVEYEDGSKAVRVRFAVLSESNQQMDQFVTDENGCFTIHKLYDKSKLVLDEEELVEMGMRFKDPEIGGDNWQKLDEKIILIFPEKCLTYENGSPASRAKYSIKDPNGETVESSVTDENGCLKLKKLYMSGGGYQVELIDENGLTIEVPLKEETKEKVVFDNIYFEFGKYSLTTGSKEVLHDLALKMKDNSKLKVTVNAHTDSRGSSKINEDLSQRRADAVAEYLQSQGIEKSRIKTKGYGETKLINDCKDGTKCSSEEHAKNRRIEFEFSWD